MAVKRVLYFICVQVYGGFHLDRFHHSAGLFRDGDLEFAVTHWVLKDEHIVVVHHAVHDVFQFHKR